MKRHKKWQRILADFLCFCILFTLPGISDAFPVAAAGREERAGADNIIIGFTPLSEEVKEQTVSAGTDVDELNLPSELTVYLECKQETTDQKAEESKQENTEQEDTEQKDTESENAGETADYAEETDMENGEEQEIEPEDTDTAQEDIEPEEGITSEETTDVQEEVTEDLVNKEDGGDINEEDAAANEQKDEAAQETHTVTLPEYQAENVIAVEIVENTQDTEPEKTAETAVTISGVTWQSEPVYDSNTEGTYIFTAVLPDGYEVAESVNLPQITVMVQTEYKASAAAGEMLRKILDKYFKGSEESVYETILAMDEDTRLFLTADYEELLAAMTQEDEADKKLQSVLGEIQRGIGDAAAKILMRGPALFGMRAAASAVSSSIPLRRISGAGNAFVYHSFNETKSFTAGNTYAFLNGVYGYEDAVSSLGSGAILKAVSGENKSLTYIRRKYGDSATVKVYVDVITKGIDFDHCMHGGLYQVPDSGTPTEYRYFCWAGGAQNCGPYYAYTYEKQSLTCENILAFLNDIKKRGSSKPEDYTVKITYNNGQSLTLDTGSYTVQVTDPDSDEVMITVSDSEGNKITANFIAPFVVSYEGNGEGVSSVPAMQQVWRDEVCKLSATTPVRTGYSFINWKDEKSGTTYSKGATATSSMRKSLRLQAQWKDVQKPDVDCTLVQVMTRTPDEDVKAAVKDALTITDNEPVEECTVTMTADANIAATVGMKTVTVTVKDKAGNTTTRVCSVEVLSFVDISTPVFTESTRNLSATLRNPGTDAITESGFVWGIMNAPTITVNNGKKTTGSPVSKVDDTILVTADNLQKGVTYYARAYIIAGGVTYYSDEILIGIGRPAYGIFTIKNNGNNTFTVTRTGGSEGSQTVYYRTVNGSAVGGTHFTHQAGTLTFSEGVTTQKITVKEQGGNAPYDGKPATAYTNAERVYSVELYRVMGGGTLGDTVSAERTMAKDSNYAVDRKIYDEQIINGPQEEKIRGDYKDDKLGWTENVAAESAKEVLSIKDNLCPASRTYWTNTAQELHYQITFNAREEAGGYQVIQITPGTVLDTTIYPEGGALKGQRSTTYYVAQFEHGGSGNANKTYAYYTFPYTSKSARKPTNTYEETGHIKEGYVVFGTTQENMAVGYGASGDNSDKWATTQVEHHFLIDDTQEPQLVKVAPMADGLYKAGDPFTVSLIFDEIVDSVNSGDLSGITVNTTWGPAKYAGGADTNVLYFTGVVSASANSDLRVSGFTNADRIKDMCNSASAKGTTNAGGDTTASVDTAQPQFTVAAKGISNGTGTAQVTVGDDKAKTNGLRYVWSDSASMPASGWVEAAASELASAKGAGLSLSIRKEPGSGSSNGKWYLHVIGTYDTTGATAYHYACVDFGTASKPAVGSAKPILTVTANNAVWATERKITIQASGAETLAYRKSGESTWKSLAVDTKSVTVTENGYYTFKLTAGDDTITRSVQVEKIDRVSPTASIGAPMENGTDKTVKGEAYIKITLPVTYTDGQSGVKEVKYAWTNSSGTPATDSGEWKTLAAGAAQITYTATESVETAKYLHLLVTDNVKHTYTTKSAAYTVIGQSMVNTRAPGITLTGAPTQWTNDMATLKWELQDYAGKNYEVILPDGRTAKTGAVSGEIWAPRNGTYTVKVRDTDYGTENTATLEVTKIDKTAPTVTVPAVSGDWTGSGWTITLSASDSESGVGKKYIKIVSTDEEKPTEGLEELTTNRITISREGIWYVYYKVYDNAGDDTIGREANKAEGFIGPIKIDLKTPRLTVVCGKKGVPKSEGLSVSMKAEYGISGGTVKEGENAIDELTFLPESAGVKPEKETVYLVTEKGNYQFTIRSGSGKTDTVGINVYEAVFETSMGPKIMAQLVAENGTLTEPETSEIAGYTCEGWYTAKTGGRLWDFETDTVSENMTLYARWKDKTPPEKPVLQEGVTLPTAWTNTQKTIPLKLYDIVGVTELWVSIDGKAYKKADGFTGGTGIVEYDYPVTEGEHTYQFRVKDAAANTSDESDVFKVKLDTAKPVIGAIAYENKAADLWNWIIGKKSLIIHVPVTDGGSGVTQITYVATPRNSVGNLDSGKAVTKTVSVKDGEAKITFDADFRGTIAISCTDVAGNAADDVAIGAESGGVIVEDRAPDITIKADRGPLDMQQTQPGGVDVFEGYYETAPALIVTVKDDMDSAVTAGIASITYQIGGDGTATQSVIVDKSTLQKAAQVTFTIRAAEIPTGITEIKIHAADNAGNENTQSITVKVKGPEKQPAAAIDYRAEELTGLIPCGQYKIDGTEITADAEGHIEIKEEWLGKTVNIVKTGNGSETTDSPALSLTIPARRGAPDAPELDSRTNSSIAVKTIEDAQYRIDDGSWQDGAIFAGLDEKTIYSFRSYYPATDTSFASPESSGAQIATMPNAPAADKLVINFTSETLTLTDGVEAFSNTGCTIPVTAGSAEDYIGKTVYIRYPASGMIPASATTPVSVSERTPTPTPGTTDASYPNAEDGAITGLTAGGSYMLSSDGGTWMSRTANESGEITGLKAGTYELYVPAGSTNFRSEKAAVTVGAKPATKYDIPDARIGYADRTLTGFEAGGKYTINGKDVTARQDKTIEIDAGWFGSTLSIVRKGNGKDKTDSDAQSLFVPAIPAAPAPTGVDVQTAGGTGKLTGLTAGTTYEVSTDGGRTWETRNADGSGEITGLAPGTYTVRVKAGTANFAGEPSKPVTIGAYKVTITFMANGKQYDTRTVHYSGTLTDIPSVPIKDNMTGNWYADERGGSVAVFTNITADMTVYAVYTYTITDNGENKNVTTEGVEKIQNTGGSDNPGGDDNEDSSNGDDDHPQPTLLPADRPQPTEPPTGKPQPLSPAKPPAGRPETEKTPEEDSGQTIPVSIEDGRITVSGEPIKTGNVKDMTNTSTTLDLGDGEVIVTVVCKEQAYTAGVADTVAVANVVLTQEQLALVNHGETIEIRIEVTDISDSVPQRDKEVIERGVEEYRREVPGLTLGMYTDLSMFIRIGEGDWNAITATREPIEVIIGIPEQLQETGRTYYIIRSHEGGHTLMNDMDDEQDTITISTDMFSSYAIGYVQAEGKSDQCGLCHICPTFLGICYFIWLAIILMTILAIRIAIRKKGREQEEQA